MIKTLSNNMKKQKKRVSIKLSELFDVTVTLMEKLFVNNI